MERNVDRRTAATTTMDAILMRAMHARGRAWIKCYCPTKGRRYVKRMGVNGLAEQKTMLQNVKHYFWFFTPGTQSEHDAFTAAKFFVKRRPSARLSVSEPCHGVCRELPVIAPFPFGDRRDEGYLTQREDVALWRVWQGVPIDDDDGEDLDELGLIARARSGEWVLRSAGEEKVRELWGAEVAA